jgi:phosphoenolpyruvate-protein kinase (PTS system EI component)
VQRSLDDSKVDAISADLRFVASFTAALTAATIALRASGYRTVTQVGHHSKIIESLELTIKVDPKLIQKLKVLSNKRNKSVYDVAGAVSDQDLKEIARACDRVEQPRYTLVAKITSRVIEKLIRQWAHRFPLLHFESLLTGERSCQTSSLL